MNNRLRKLPRARTGYQVQGSLANDVPAFGGADYDAYMGKASPQVRKTMGAVPREAANIEAEGGETLVGDIDGSTFPSFFNIKGPRHSEGGVPMNLPDDTFIFSDTKSMKITDPKILKMFNKSPKSGGYTPAELSKIYDINKYRKTLQDPDANKMEKKTAEMMIKNYVMKLGALAIAQESKKGFPQGIPVIAKPYMEANGITEADLMPEIAKQQQQQQQMMEQMQSAPQEQMMEAPTEMPSEEPVAQPSMEQGMQEQPPMTEQDMMAMQQQDASQMQQAPMAMYGMSMGGYAVPFAEYGMAMGANPGNYMGRTKKNLGSGPFVAKEGIIIGGMNMPLIMSGGGALRKYGDGDEIRIKQYEEAKTKAGNITPMGTSNKFSGKKQSLKEYLKSWESNIPGISKMSEGEAQKAMYEWSLKNNPDAIRQMWLTHGLTAQGMSLADQKKLSQDATGKFTEEMLKDPEVLAKLQASYVDKKFGIRQLDPNKKPDEVPDEEKSLDKCYCIDPETGQEVEVALTNGECLCEEETESSGTGYDPYQQSWQIPMQWTPQDERNLAAAIRTRTGIEYPTAMTYNYPEIELAKQEWLGQVQALQGQGAKNLDVMSRTAGPSTAKQAAAASLEGDIAEQAVRAIRDTQAENVRTENQERSMNYQGDIAEGQNRVNTLNQYWDKVGALRNNYRGELNAKDALTTQMMNQGDTTAANIYNLQTEQFGIDPRTGKNIFKTGKPLQSEKPGQDMIEYAQQLEASHLPEDVQELILKTQFGKYGGKVMQIGGMVYGDSVYPFYYYE